METKRNITSLIPLITLTWPNQSPNPNFQPFFFYLAMYQKGQRKLDNNSQGKGSPVKGLPSHKRNRSKHKFTATSAPRKSLQRKKKEKLIKRENSYKKKKKKKSIVPNTFTTRNHTWPFPKTKRKKGYCHRTCHDSCEKIVFSSAANNRLVAFHRVFPYERGATP